MGIEEKRIEQIWWEQTNNPEHFTNKIVDTLNQGKSILIPDFNSMPWQSYFIEKIHKTGALETITDNISNVEECMLEKCCEIEGDPTPNLGFKTRIIEFIAKKKSIFHNMFFLIYLNENMLDEWARFIREYSQSRNKESSKAAFLLLLESEDYDAKKIVNRKGIEIFSFKESINEYDRIVFAMLASYSLKISSILKTYLTELACNVAGNNIELSSKCLQKHEDFLKNPVQTIKNIIDNDTDSNGCPFLFSKTKDEIEQAVWTAQIRTFYPLLEEYRRDFIKKYRAIIETHLPIKTTSFDETIDTPEEIGLGILFYMTTEDYSKKMGKKLNIYYKEKEELFTFKEARNSLSHLTILSFEEIQKLMETSFVKNRAKI